MIIKKCRSREYGFQKCFPQFALGIDGAAVRQDNMFDTGQINS